MTRFGGIGYGTGEFDGPFAVALDRKGDVFVADAYDNLIQMFKPVQ